MSRLVLPNPCLKSKEQLERVVAGIQGILWVSGDMGEEHVTEDVEWNADTTDAIRDLLREIRLYPVEETEVVPGISMTPNSIALRVQPLKFKIRDKADANEWSGNVSLFKISVTKANGVWGGLWAEGFGSEAEVHAFIRGVKAGASMQGAFGVFVDWDRTEQEIDVEVGSK